MPRKTRTRALPLLRALRGLEERRELRQVRRPEILEARHRRARVHARRTRQVVDLELGSLVLRPLGRQVRRAREAAARALVAVAVEAADLREDLRAGEGGGVPREALLLGPRPGLGPVLAPSRLPRPRALPGPPAPRAPDPDRGDHRAPPSA